MKLTREVTTTDRYGEETTMRDPTACGWALAAGVVLAIIAIPWVYMVSTDTVKQDAVGVVVGGGPLDPSKAKVKGETVERPGRIWHGTYDKVQTFPNAQTVRFQDYSVAATTEDGKSVVLSGQLGFRFGAKRVAGGWAENDATIMAFAKGVGARQYGSERLRPGEGIDGFKAFLDVMVVPEIVASIKAGTGGAYCADFEPACRVIDPRANVPETNPEAVYGPLAESIQRRVERKLGGPYLTDFQLSVKSIQLTEDVQNNIDRLAAEQAKTKAAEQSERTAAAEARAIEIKGRALERNKSLAGVEIVKQCGGNCTVIVDGTGKVNGTSVATR